MAKAAAMRKFRLTDTWKSLNSCAIFGRREVHLRLVLCSLTEVCSTEQTVQVSSYDIWNCGGGGGGDGGGGGGDGGGTGSSGSSSSNRVPHTGTSRVLSLNSTLVKNGLFGQLDFCFKNSIFIKSRVFSCRSFSTETPVC